MSRKKKNRALKTIGMVSTVALAASMSAGARADDSPGFFSGMFSDFDFSIGGFVRPETAVSTGYENPNNQRGNIYNGVPVNRQAGDPLTGFGPILANSQLITTLNGIPAVSTLLGSLPVVNGQLPISDTVTRPIHPSNNVFNYHILRAEVEFGAKFTQDLKLVGRLRGIGDFGHYSDFNAAELSSISEGKINSGEPALYGGAPNLFQYIVEGDKHPNPLEIAGPNYQLYFPALFLDYNRGPLNVRVGQQQIAWGQAIFFRVLDVVDGLDLRRHSILDYAQEEFSDKRIPAPAIRVGYQFTDAMLLDSFVQKFQPSILGNPNTPYNIIPAQFTVHDLYSQGGYEDKPNYGMRFKADFGQFGFQAIAVRRYNPDGVFRWTASNFNRNLPNVDINGNPNLLGITENTLNSGAAGTQTTGQLLSQTAFSAEPGGVYSGDEWFHYAASARLNAIDGLNAAITEFPATGPLLASPAADYQSAHNELDTFFIAAGGSLRGHIAREYFQETVLGGGVSYVTEATPGSILDQIIINAETSYTPNRTFTSPSLSRDYLKQDSLVSALVVEKYHRFSPSFPATYFVLQYMHRTKDDLVGRSLQGYNGTDTSAATGVNGANYVVFAFQQPFPRDVYRIGFASLYDPRGGILVQPGIQWKPGNNLSFDLFYSYLNGHLGGNPNKNVVSSLDFADEISIRMGYQF